MKQTTDAKEIEELFNAGAHLGHKRNRLHPKAKKYVYKMVNGTAVIDLTLTLKQINAAKEFMAKAAKEEKKILVVATKKIASQFTSELCQKMGISYITTKWMPGLLTNFDTLVKNVKKMNELEEQKNNGAWDKFVKHERTQLTKELNKLKRLYSGLSKLDKKPDVLFIVDIKKEKNALIEAKKNKLPSVALIDTNANPETVTFPIVANDDSATSAQLIIGQVIGAYTNSK